ncbi:MAG: hypothetical protein NT129_02755 [Candidatus Aenigmarchaeota archaeon]|nr:hypothetical protein [Candidatus Aenigmarchaeota archaeon]
MDYENLGPEEIGAILGGKPLPEGVDEAKFYKVIADRLSKGSIHSCINVTGPELGDFREFNITGINTRPDVDTEFKLSVMGYKADVVVALQKYKASNH